MHYVFLGFTGAAFLLSAFANTRSSIVAVLFKLIHAGLLLLRACFFLGYFFVIYL